MTLDNLSLRIPRAQPSGPDVEVIWERIRDEVKEYEDRLENGEEVELWCASPKGPMRVVDVGFHSAYLMVLWGTDEAGSEAKMLVSPWSIQLQVLIRKLPAGAKRTPIGFSGSASTPLE